MWSKNLVCEHKGETQNIYNKAKMMVHEIQLCPKKNNKKEIANTANDYSLRNKHNCKKAFKQRQKSFKWKKWVADIQSLLKKKFFFLAYKFLSLVIGIVKYPYTILYPGRANTPFPSSFKISSIKDFIFKLQALQILTPGKLLPEGNISQQSIPPFFTLDLVCPIPLQTVQHWIRFLLASFPQLSTKNS